ncbi:MAG: DUF559 domain-containing protein, partial [Bacteroidota bacterium]|nr:DUF559 domain-containing protein [Bacteroidota bacterium]
EEVISELGMSWKIGIRNGDTEVSERQRQTRQMPEVLIITPESLHLLLAQKGYPEFFKTLKIIAVDEWHELLGSKRGVQVELAISRIVGSHESGVDSQESSNISQENNSRLMTQNSGLSIWGISATIGNLEQAKDVLLSPLSLKNGGTVTVIVKSGLKKNIEVESIFPDEIEKYPWAGHLGIKLVEKVIPIIENSRTTLIFINTRGMSERWYQSLLDASPDLAGLIALHHGSIELELRTWVEEALHSGKLKAVVCTSSLDLGVDFRPVETVIQVGSPKGVARFLQRAGRSGHQPDAVSKIYFLPTHSLELVEAAALKSAIAETLIESREPMMLCFDVLIQYLGTLAISEGFKPAEIFKEVKATHCYRDMTEEEWNEILYFITAGGTALQQYDEYKKVEIIDGLYKINSRRVAMRHRLHIGTIVSDAMLHVKFMTGGYVGIIEEWFISRLEAGDVFTLAGRNLEYVMIKDMTVLVRKSTSKKSIVPSWQGGRVPLSANLGKKLRETLSIADSLDTPSPLERGQGVRSDEKITGDSSTPRYYTTDPITWKRNLSLAKEMRHAPTEAEKNLWEYLRNRKLEGFKFRRQHSIDNFIADFICIEAKLIIELDGNYHTEYLQKKYDEERTRLLSSLGYRVIRFFNSDVISDITTVIRIIREHLLADLTPTPLHGRGALNLSERTVPVEISTLKPLFELQQQLSHVPKANELLIEQIETKDGFHLFVYPFEGRLVHEAMAAILAYRISRITPITFSFAMNDYGFELLSDQPIPVDDSNVYEL